MMKRIPYILPIAVLIAGILFSCSKDDERINGMETRINALESEKIVSLKSQIEGIASSIADLGSLKESLQELAAEGSAQRSDIPALKAADESLTVLIANLQSYANGKLVKYADKDIVAATYATLAQYSATLKGIESLEVSIGELDSQFGKELKALEDSLSEWQRKLNEAFDVLTGRVEALEQLIQGISIIPAYSDESVAASNGILTMQCIVKPASAVERLTRENFTLLLNSVRTKALNLDSLKIGSDAEFAKDAETGTVSFRADISGFIPPEGRSLAVAVNVRSGATNFTTRFATVHFNATDEDLNIADALFHSAGASSFLEFRLEKGDAPLTKSGTSSYPAFIVKTTSAYEAGFIEGTFEIESAVLSLSATESRQYTGGTVAVTCTSTEGIYNFAGRATGEGVDDFEFKAVNIKVAAHQAADGTTIVLKDKGTSDPERIAVSGVSLSNTTIDINAINTVELTATVEPADASNHFVTWKSDNPSVATVNAEGKVTGLAEGTAVITATTADEMKTAECVVTVSVIPVTSITLDKESASIYEGGECHLTAAVEPQDASYKEIIWTSSNPSVATVDDTGRVKGVGTGTATIKATNIEEAVNATCTVTVVDTDSFISAFTVGAGADPSVSSDDIKVHFSKSHLNYNASTGEFGFEADQYTCPAQSSERDANHLVHFYWSRTASVAYSTAAYSDTGKATSDILFTNATDTTPSSGFTVAGKRGKYRVLSKAEWVYLFEGRPDHDNKYGFGKVNGTNGIIILPDEFTDPVTNGGSGAFVPKANSTGWNSNSYEGTGWTAMEEACAVFLPAAGNLGVSGIGNVNTSGYFWSSDAPAENYNIADAYCLYFGSSNIDPDNSNQRSGACPIRLVSE